MIYDSIRDWIKYLEERNSIAVINREVRIEFEISAVIKKLEALNKAAFFKSVKGYDIPVISGLSYERELFAELLDTSVERINEKYIKAIQSPLKCRLIDSKDAVIKQNSIAEEDIDLKRILPAPVHHEKDGGQYITAGLLIAKDPETGMRNVSIHRLQFLGGNELGVLILPRHLAHMHQKAEALNKPLDIVVAIGVDPVLLLASQTIAQYGADELEIAGALRGRPVDLVKGDTVDVEYPAFSEIVLEGQILPKIRKTEGPFGEFPKYYGPADARPVIKIKKILHRDEPVFHTILPATREHFLLGGIAREANIFEMIRHAVPTVTGVNLTYGGSCRYHVVVSIDKKNEGEAKNAMMAAFASTADIKNVVIVDKDINIFDMEEVEWALATRFQADKDLVVISNSLGSKLDPSTIDGLGAKIGFDATVPIGSLDNKFEKIFIPGMDEMDIDEYI